MRRAAHSSARRSSDATLAFERGRAELLALPARVFSRLPLVTRIEVQSVATKQVFVWSSGELPSTPKTARRGEAGRTQDARARASWLDGSEVDAIVLGLEAERTFSADLTAFSLRKMHDPGFRVTEAHVLAGAEAPARTGRGPTLGAVLEALDLELLSIDVAPPMDRSVEAPAAA